MKDAAGVRGAEEHSVAAAGPRGWSPSETDSAGPPKARRAALARTSPRKQHGEGWMQPSGVGSLPAMNNGGAHRGKRAGRGPGTGGKRRGSREKGSREEQAPRGGLGQGVPRRCWAEPAPPSHGLPLRPVAAGVRSAQGHSHSACRRGIAAVGVAAVPIAGVGVPAVPVAGVGVAAAPVVGQHFVFKVKKLFGRPI